MKKKQTLLQCSRHSFKKLKAPILVKNTETNLPFS